MVKNRFQSIRHALDAARASSKSSSLEPATQPAPVVESARAARGIFGPLTRRQMLGGIAGVAGVAALPSLSAQAALSAAIRNLSSTSVQLPSGLDGATLLLAPGATQDFTYSRLSSRDLDSLVSLARAGTIDFPGDASATPVIQAGLPASARLTYALNGQEPGNAAIGATVFSINDGVTRTLKEQLPPVNGTTALVPVWVSAGFDYFGSAGAVPGRSNGKNFVRNPRTVICLGGVDDLSQNSVDIFDAQTNTTTRSPNVAMLNGAPRFALSAQWVGQISADQYVVMGGEQCAFGAGGLGDNGPSGPPLIDRSSHVYDARTDSWTRAGDIPYCASVHCNYQDQEAIRLDDGRILVPGGITIEISIDEWNNNFSTGTPATLYSIDTISVVFTPGPPGHPERGTWDYTRSGANTALSRALSADDATVHVASTAGFPESGTFSIDLPGATPQTPMAELVDYTSKSANAFHGCTRGASFSPASASAEGACVKQLNRQFAGCDHFQQCKLADGRVLVVEGGGGLIFNDVVLAPFGYTTLIFDASIHAQLFVPCSNSWARVPNMPLIAGEDDRFPPGVSQGARQQPVLAATRDNRAIVCGGYMGQVDLWPDAATTLTADIDEVTTTIPVDSTSGFRSAGRIMIGQEWIDYSSITPTSFEGCIRGAAIYIGPPASAASGSAVVRIRFYDSFVTDVDAPGALQDNNYRKSTLIFDTRLFDAGRDPWVQTAPSTWPRFGVSLVPIDDRRFVVTLNGGNPIEYGNPYGGWPNVEIFDLVSQTWTTGAAEPLGTFDSPQGPLEFVYFAPMSHPALLPDGRLLSLAIGNISDFGDDIGCIYYVGNPSGPCKRREGEHGSMPRPRRKRLHRR